MRNYRIAFFTADWNYELSESALHGMQRFVDEHKNVRLCVFDCFGKDIGNAKDLSEYGIFELADLSQFDGVLIQGNQIVLQSVRDAIGRRVAQVGIPAVTIDCPIEGCALISVDNQDAQYAIADHVIRHHGARRLVYITGMLANGCPEGQQRLDGFLSACRDNGVDMRDVEVLEGTWRTSDGLELAERWHRENRPLPDAFICGNDEMALGLIEGLRQHGRRIPEDVRVTGFDNLNSAELSQPRLSSIGRNYADMNYRGLQMLINRIDGVDDRPEERFPFEAVYSESCGCRESARHDTIRERYYQQTRFLKNFYALQDQMAEEMFNAVDLPELLKIVEKHHSIFGCRNVYVCINDYYYDTYDRKQWGEKSTSFGDEMVLAAAAGDTVLARSHDHERFPRAKLLPDHLKADKPFLVFYPLHYNTISIGYLAMDGISEAAKLNLHESIFSFLEIAIENVRKKGLLRHLNHVLDNLYVHDALTGLYNRFGFERFAQQTFNAFTEQNGGAQVLFVDMDDMKGINDRYGHEVGDEAIRATARILQDTCSPLDFLMRYGGDEFLIIASLKEACLAEAIQSALQTHELSASLPCVLGLSVGAVRSEPSQPRTLEQCIQEADALMYQTKKRRRLSV